jgi:hypothetical protein
MCIRHERLSIIVVDRSPPNTGAHRLPPITVSHEQVFHAYTGKHWTIIFHANKPAWSASSIPNQPLVVIKMELNL